MNHLPKPATGWACRSFALLGLLAAAALPAGAQTLAARLHSQSVAPLQETTRISLREALTELETRYKIVLAYKDHLVSEQVVSDGAWRQQTGFEAAIERLLSPFDLTYKKVGKNTYVLKAGRKGAPAASPFRTDSSLRIGMPGVGSLPGTAGVAPVAVTLTGRVTGGNAEALPGVNVLLKGTTSGTTTDSDGKYALSLPDDQADGTLVFSFIGYTTREVAIGNRTTIDVSLVADIKSLSEVVVIGYGTQEKRDVLGAISSVKGEDLRKVPVSGLDQALQGRAAGVVVTQNTGDPGGGVSIRIRGTGTQRNNEPLYVIDGFPVSSDNLSSAGNNGSNPTANNGNNNGSSAGQPSSVLSTINPNDIESIEVLKDASAAAIYGSRAANGVVLITTKRGKEGKASVNFDAYYGLSQATRFPRMMNAAQFTEVVTEFFTNTNQLNRIDPAWSNPEHNTNWVKEAFRVAPIQNYNLSVSGGNASTRAAVSANYFRQDGIIRFSDFERFSFRANIDQQVGKKLKLGNSFTLSRTSARETSAGDFSTSGFFRQLMSAWPTWPVRDPDGSYNQPTYYGAGTPSTLANPIARIDNDRYALARTRMLGTLFGEYQLLPGLTYKLNLGIDYIGSNRQNDKPTYPGASPSRQGVYTLEEFRSDETVWLIENTLTYAKTFGRHNLNVLAGTTAQQSNSNSIAGTANSATPIRSVSATVESQRNLAAGVYNQWSLLSYLGRLNYAFADKYLVSATIRRDGSSRFGTNNKWGVFPSFSVGWRVSEEGFLRNLAVVSDLKLRASRGTLGNQEIGLYDYLGTLTNDRAAYTFGTGQTLQPGLYINNLGNANLQWEKSTQTNLGLDASLFNNRLDLTLDYFLKSTTGLLIPVNVPITSGVGSITRNAGEVQNRGLEAAVTYRNGAGNFHYALSANGSLIRNEVIALADEDQVLAPGQVAFSGPSLTRIEAGYPIGYFYGFIMDGIFQNQAQVDAHAKQNAGPGDVIFRDINGRDADGELTGQPDGQINDDDQTLIGNPIPKFTYGFNANLDYKGVDLSLFFYGVQGNDIFNATKYFNNVNSWDINNGFIQSYERWRGEGTSNVQPRNAPNDNNNYRNSTYFIEKGSYLRLRNVQLGYTFPKALSTKVGMERLRVYVSAQNLFTITNYSGFDPEVGSFNQSAQFSGYDLGRYPTAQTYLLGVNVQF